MSNILRQRILRHYDYDVVDYLSVSTKHENVTYKYVMLPVYVGNFTFRQKLYNFFVNGTTGKTYGKYPKSGFKIGTLILLGLGLAAVVAYFLLKG